MGKMVSERIVFDHGKVTLVDYLGDDRRILESARISTGAEPDKGEKKDKGLIRYLYKNQHMTPFEQVVTTWRIKCPIFVARQWHRHRTQSINEVSGRYTELPTEFYTPDDFKYQSNGNHQSSGEVIPLTSELSHMYRSPIASAYAAYSGLLYMGVSKEQARMVLPVAQYTEFFTTMNLRNLFHFLGLRLHEHAQFEIRSFAEAMLSMLKELPDLSWSISAFEEFNELDHVFRDAINASKTDTSELLNLLKGYMDSKK